MNYRHHSDNSARGFVHLIFDLYGEDAARALGEHMKLKLRTIDQYVREFGDFAKLVAEKDRRLRGNFDP